ncbi:unnamed protein product [Brachionus calyciflorus]|uniref:Uncharacterized protein n=1 Tax=Brachionus calyciflorus TaxID=104777 RepID=A0A813QEC4_9BILA|nr:unnamed protein product [Brachionus calyciflorus]
MTSQKIICILFIFFFSASLFDLSESLKCYKCDSVFQSDCSDPFRRNPNYLERCDGGKCFKSNVEGRVQRGCSFICNPASELSCCISDGCNSSNSFNTNIFFNLMGLITILVLIKFF